MKASILRIFLAVMIATSFLNCDGCKDKMYNPCDAKVCDKGFECDQGNCYCPPSKKRVGALCDTLSKYRFYATPNCFCFDTLFMDVSDYDGGEVYVTCRVYYAGTKENYTTETSAEYKKTLQTPVGDSFIAYLGFGLCTYKDSTYWPELRAKYISKDSIKGQLRWHRYVPGQFGTIKDTCDVFFHK